MANILSVNGVALPTPTSMDYKEADLQLDGYRDERGIMHKTTVRFAVRTIKVKWEYALSDAQLRAIKSAITGSEYMTVTYYCENQSQSGTMTAYVGDRDYSLKRVNNGVGKWKGLAVSFIEQ